MTRMKAMVAGVLVALAVPQVEADPGPDPAVGGVSEAVEKVVNATVWFYENLDPDDSPEDIINHTLAFVQMVRGLGEWIVDNVLCQDDFSTNVLDVANTPVFLSGGNEVVNVKLPGYRIDSFGNLELGRWIHSFRIEGAVFMCAQDLAADVERTVEKHARLVGGDEAFDTVQEVVFAAMRELPSRPPSSCLC